MLTGSVGPAFSKPYSGGAIPVGSVGPTLTAPPAGMNSLGLASGSDGMADESNSTETSNAAPTDTSIVDGEINEIIPANVNSRVSPCPGYEGSGLVGYSTLEDLIDDVLDYHASFITPMPTYYPTATAMPTTTTRSPTYYPTEEGSGLPPTDVPTTNAPTYAPITYRPTEFPT
jgi:hypothetical protein